MSKEAAEVKNSEETNLVQKFVKSFEGKPIIVNKWNAQEVRIAIDDLIAKYLTEVEGYKQDDWLVHFKLISLLLMNIIGGATALIGYLWGFKATKVPVAIGSSLYLVLLGAWTLYTGVIACNAFFRGSSKFEKSTGATVKSHGHLLWLKSQLETIPKPIYKVTFLQQKNAGCSNLYSHSRYNLKEEQAISNLSFPITNWIFDDGRIDVAALAVDAAKISAHQRSVQKEN